MSNITQTKHRSALLVAGMHRSGTSALTRVLSYLGADLPENLAPALPNNNETGFWESVDLMILHDDLLKSAGSSWNDWTTFNPDWHKSDVGKQFKYNIQSVVRNDFGDSSLFVVKDPRICRFLPLWLDILKEEKTEPYAVIPIRNPLEVAQSLKARDGLPIATGGLIWLRHVLDAVYFSAEIPRAFVSYRDLMDDWHFVVDSISKQLGLVFPCMSPIVELDVEQYLDPHQKHNHATLADVKKCRDFSPLLISVYESILVLLDDPSRGDVIQALLVVRDEFNETSSQYGKVLYATEQLHQKQVRKYEQQSADYESRLKQRLVDNEGCLKQLIADHNEQLADYAGRLEQQSADYEGRLEQQSADYEDRLEQQSADYEDRLEQQSADYDSRLKQQCEIDSQQYNDRLTLHVSGLEAKLFSKEQEKSAINFAFSSSKRALGRLRQDYVNTKEQQALLLEKPGGGRILGYRKNKTKPADLLRKSVFFDSEFYLSKKHSSDRIEGVSAPEYFLSKGEGVPHPLFDMEWYLHQYPDVREARLNPLVHFIKYGAEELRQPHPLFNAKFYREKYPESNVSNLSPLEHYLKYGIKWYLAPHPLFDHKYYIKQLHESLDEEASPLVHYLQYPHAWRYSPCAAFDGGWYLEEYLDVAEAEINPLLHYVVRGAAEGRKPHPEFDTEAFQARFAQLFLEAGFSSSVSFDNDVDPVLSADSQRGQDTQERSSVLVDDQRFSRMLDFPRRSLAPISTGFNDGNLTIHWVTCDFAPKGGGGNMTIFRFVRLFELLGHQQHIWLHNHPVHNNEDGAFEDIVRNYQQLSAQIHFICDGDVGFSDAEGDIIIATDWESVWPVLSTTHFKRRFYFVQDHEPSFFPAGGHSLAAEATYHEDLDCICAGPWLEKLMEERYGRWATKFWLAADKSCYYPADALVDNKVLRVAFYARRHTERRAVDLGLLALEQLAQQGAQFHVDVYGGDDNQAILSAAGFAFTDHGVLNARELGELYRQCDIGVVFSATNYSLVPQEMMMCGLAVLELAGDNTRAVFPDDVVTLVNPHPGDIAKGLASLLCSKEKRIFQAEKGREWASQFDWSEGAQQVSDDIQNRLVDLGYERLPKQAQRPVKVSVVIPVLNGGKLLVKVLQAVRSQSAPWPFEVLVIDSGSTDSALDEVGEWSDVQIHSIPKSEFSHGGTRNLGVELTSGEYIAFLTQDALPADEFWLFNLVSMLEHEPQAAGVFGAHLPYSEASAFVKRDLSAHFRNLEDYPLYLDKNTDKDKFESGDQGWRQVLHFYSDNNSCMRRSVWEEIPYPVIEYGEDQVWADEIIKAGYKKAYAINAVVYHSHDYDERENYERSKTEAQFFYEYFGYRLAGSEVEVQRTIDALNKMDEQYGNKLQLAEGEIERQKQLNRSRLKGYQAALLDMAR